MKHKTPTYYRAPLKSRAEIVAFLTTAQNSRPAYGLFAFNVKVHSTDLSFDHLTKLAIESGELSASVSKRYLDACRELHNEQKLYDWATESARDGVMDCETYSMLWDGNGAIANWEFNGRSGGWLVLTEFEGIKLAGRSLDFTYSDLADLPFPQLRRLYRFIVQCQHDFNPGNVRSEVEYQAAFDLFSNVCANVETDEDAATREAREAREAEERAHWEQRDTVTTR